MNSLAFPIGPFMDVGQVMDVYSLVNLFRAAKTIVTGNVVNVFRATKPILDRLSTGIKSKPWKKWSKNNHFAKAFIFPKTGAAGTFLEPKEPDQDYDFPSYTRVRPKPGNV